MSVITVAQVKAILGISGTDEDAKIQTSINIAQSMVESYIGGPIEVTNQTLELFDQEYQNAIYMPHRPLTEVTTVTKDDVELVAGTDYRADLKNGRLIFGNRCAPSNCCVAWAALLEVEYKSGWATCPADLFSAMMNITIAVYNLGGYVAISTAGSGALKSLTMFDAMSMSFDVGSESSSMAAETIVKQWSFVLDEYQMRHPVMA